MKKYRKKNPGWFRAEQFFPDKQPWPMGVSHVALHQIEGTCNVPYPFTPYGGWTSAWFRVGTINGTIKIQPGDWIVDDNTRRYSPNEFMATFEEVIE